jgi:hypothetical protein
MRPGSPAEAKPQAVARAKERYDRLLKSAESAGRAMVGDAKLAMQDLEDYFFSGKVSLPLSS